MRRLVIAVAATALAALWVAAPAVAAPANDELADAQTVGPTLPVSVAATTVGATGESGETLYSNPATESVWFQWTPAASTPAIVDLCSGDFSGGSSVFGIGVYTGGTTFASLTTVREIAGPCKLEFNATGGTTYKIQIDYLHAQGSFTFTLRRPQRPANDDFANAQDLGSALPVSVPGSTVDATWESGEPNFLGGSGRSRSVWYSWTAPITGQVQLSGCPFTTLPGFAANMSLGIYTGSTLGSLSPVAETNNCALLFNASSGVTYKIAFSGNIEGEGTFTLGLRQATPPANDDLAAARTLGPALPLSVRGDDSFATAETGESTTEISGLEGSAHSVWYQWTPTTSQRVKLNACEAEGEPRLGVFTGGTTISSLTDATEPQNEYPYCAVELNAVAGTTYKIAVTTGDFNGGTGSFTLEIHGVHRPGNDNFASAETIGPDLPIAIDGDNTDATVETGEPQPAQYFEPLASVWYRWDSGFSGPVQISTCGSATNDFAAVQVGSSFATMSRLVPSGEDGPDSCGASSKGGRETFTAVAGTTYWIQVSSVRKGIEGPFHLTIVDPNAKPMTPPALSSPPPVVAQPPVPGGFNLKNAIGKCRAHFKGKSRRARSRRARCIRAAKRKAAMARCRTIESTAQRQSCLTAVRRKYRRHRAHRQKR